MGFGGFKQETGLNDILRNIKKAADDPNIAGVYLDLSVIPAGMANIYEIREALSDFKSSGKPIYCYGDLVGQSAYYLASIADEIYLNPEGAILFTGLSADVMFLQGTLEKLDIEAQIIRHGSFKSAIEPFTRKDFRF